MIEEAPGQGQGLLEDDDGQKSSSGFNPKWSLLIKNKASSKGDGSGAAANSSGNGNKSKNNDASDEGDVGSTR